MTHKKGNPLCTKEYGMLGDSGELLDRKEAERGEKVWRRA
jgi:hypothetical protein